ncbi:putative chitin biosynthesis protein [Diplodia seriata]|uniref:Putative chitin biosynthesis protein n=1 Tax=Diplodia seriata TaxID=420778 RepID=A0A0G2GZA7_9PEZI|nr:putative chitin biosynthesis protein [Diplodia seriata]
MLVSLTVGKVDAGVAVLLTEDKRLIEFPSILLPPDISSGSIVDITVARNHQSEQAAQQAFQQLQAKIYQTFGTRTPEPPILRCRNATQTSVVLEWDPVQLATAELRSLSLYRNGSKAGSIPRPKDMQSTKISGLAVDTEYVFHLVLRTSAGTFSSERLAVRTHKMTDLSGITITPGIMPAQLRESLAETAERVGAKMIDQVRIDTTHFVCTEGRGPLWEKAVEMNIPVVVPDWVKGCEREGRIVGVRQYYINADPRLRQMGPASGGSQHHNVPSHGRSQSMAAQQASAKPSPMPSPRTEITPPTPEQEDGKSPSPEPGSSGNGSANGNGNGALEEPTDREGELTPQAAAADASGDESDGGTETPDGVGDDEKRLEAGAPPSEAGASPSVASFQDVAL